MRASGKYQKDERKRTTDDASLVTQSAVETGVDSFLRDKSEGNLFTDQTAVGVKVA